MSQKDGKVMMIDQDVTKGMGTEHDCPGFSWDRVNCLPSSWYSAMF